MNIVSNLFSGNIDWFFVSVIVFTTLSFILLYFLTISGIGISKPGMIIRILLLIVVLWVSWIMKNTIITMWANPTSKIILTIIVGFFIAYLIRLRW